MCPSRQPPYSFIHSVINIAILPNITSFLFFYISINPFLTYNQSIYLNIYSITYFFLLLKLIIKNALQVAAPYN